MLDLDPAAAVFGDEGDLNYGQVDEVSWDPHGGEGIYVSSSVSLDSQGDEDTWRYKFLRVLVRIFVVPTNH